MEDLWTFLARCGQPICCYGTGNGADKIIDVLENRGIALDAVFASDGFVRNRTFRGYPVRSYSDVRAEYGDDMVVMLAFGTTLPDVTAFVEELDRRHALRIPDVPLYGGALFDEAYYEAHRGILEEAESLFADERSRQLFRDAISFRLTGEYRYLADVQPPIESYRELFGHRDCHTVIDGGAFRGDSTRDLIEALHPGTVLAVEADPKTYLKLEVYAAAETDAVIRPIHGALWDSDGEVSYASSGSRGAAHDGHNRRSNAQTVPTVAVDSIADDAAIDFIKLDVEGAEERALLGAKGVILRDRPHLAVSLYHRTDDLFSLPLLLREWLPDHRFYLRRAPCIPMWDLSLFAVRP